MNRFIKTGERIWFATGLGLIVALVVGMLMWAGVIR